MKENTYSNGKEKIRVVTLLSRKQVDYLDRMGKDALFFKGKKLSRSQVLADLVDMLIESGISIEQLELSDERFSSQLLKTLRQPRKAEALGEEEVT